VVLDSAEPGAPIGKNDWMTAEQAAGRIGRLEVQWPSSPLTLRLADALKLLGKIADDKKDSERAKRARVLFVFSDRTRAAWDIRQRKSLQTLANQVPPAFERLAAVRAEIPEMLQLLPELRQKLPLAASADFPEQVLIERLQKLQERIPQLRADDYPDAESTALLTVARGKQQDLLALLEKPAEGEGSSEGEEAKVYRNKLLTALRTSLRNSAGFTSFYIDVGIAQPTDLALVDLQLAPDETATKVRVDVQATGEEFQPTLNASVDGTELPPVVVSVKPGKRESVLFDLKDKLAAGLHQVKVYVKTADSLLINNGRYLTYAVRRVLLLTDTANPETELWKKAIKANTFGPALFECEIATPGDIQSLEDYDAVFLCNLKAPAAALWAQLQDYVAKGRGVGVLPPLDDAQAYKAGPAQEVLPATFMARHRADQAAGARWNWEDDIYKHPLLQPFKEWQQLVPPPDLFAYPRGAQQYWKVEPRPQSQVLVRYDNGDPAVLERMVDRKKGKPGRVLLLTTPPGWAEWNNYGDRSNSFFVILGGRTAAYLTGDLDRPALNFLSSAGGALVPVPPRAQAESYKLLRESGALSRTFVGPVTAEAHFNEARAQPAAEPGNYTLVDEAGELTAVSQFSVNLPGEESDLSRTAVSEIDAVLGHDAVLAVEARTDLQEAMRGHISNPWELFPVLMVALLLVLAVENLLANRFYRREPTDNAANATAGRLGDRSESEA
jgi:hypothetical protein